MGEFWGGLTWLLLFVFAVIMGIIWIIVPIALLGIRSRLDRMLVLMEKRHMSAERLAVSETAPDGANPGKKDETSQTRIIEKAR